MEINKVFDLIEKNEFQTLKELLDNGFDVNGSDSDGYSLLHMSVDFDNESAVRLLLSYKSCRINGWTTVHRLTALHFASEDGKTHLVKVLLDSGADINCVNHNNCTPLYMSVCGNHLATVHLLLERGADPNISDTNGISPLLQAVSISKELTTALLERNTQISDYCRELHTSLLSNKPEISHIILDRLSTPLSANRIGRSVLQNAVQHISCDDPNEAIALIKRLIESGEDINISNRFGSPLHILIQRNKTVNSNEDNNFDPTSVAIFQFLVSQQNCELNCEVKQILGTNEMTTPLTLAFKLNKYIFAEILIRCGADLNKCRFNLFKYTKNADSVLKLLFLSGYKFKENFLQEIRPLNDEHLESFLNFKKWFITESSSVMSLKNLTRITIRNYYHKSIHKVLESMDFPKDIYSFLLFK